MKILRHLDHENVLRILDVCPPSHPDFEDVYLSTELMDTDLHKVIYSTQVLTGLRI